MIKQYCIDIIVIDSNVSHDELVIINNVLKEYDEAKNKIKKLKNSSKILVYL